MLFYILASVSFLSLVLSLILIWYTRNLVRYISLFTEDSRVMLDSLRDYYEHLNNVYGMDLFYGDATLESLLEHTKNITEEVNDFVSTTEQLSVENNND